MDQGDWLVALRDNHFFAVLRFSQIMSQAILQLFHTNCTHSKNPAVATVATYRSSRKEGRTCVLGILDWIEKLRLTVLDKAKNAIGRILFEVR